MKTMFDHRPIGSSKMPTASQKKQKDEEKIFLQGQKSLHLVWHCAGFKK